MAIDILYVSLSASARLALCRGTPCNACAFCPVLQQECHACTPIMGFPMEGVSACLSRNDKHVLHGESYKRLTPPRNTTKQRRPTVNPSDRQSAQLTDKAPGTIERAGNEVSRMTPTSTATLHASSTAAPSQHHTDPAGSSPESSQPTQPSAHRMHMRAEPHGSTDTSGDRRHPPYGEPYIRMNWWTTTDTWPASVGGGGGVGGVAGR